MAPIEERKIMGTDLLPLVPGYKLGAGKATLVIPTEDDLEYIRNLWAQPETMEPVGGPLCYSVDKMKIWYARIIDSGSPTDCYFLILNEEQKPVGEISFHNFDADSGSAYFNIKIEAISRGKHYAREAVKPFFSFFFKDLQGEKLIDDVSLSNFSGQQALLSMGFEHNATINQVYLVTMTKERYNRIYPNE